MAEDHLFRHQGLSKDICLRETLHKVFNAINIRACETGCWIVEGGPARHHPAVDWRIPGRDRNCAFALDCRPAHP